jgi:hypothetical protein
VISQPNRSAPPSVAAHFFSRARPLLQRSWNYEISVEIYEISVTVH